MTLLKNAAAGLGLKGFPFGGPSATSGLRPGLGTLPLVGGISQSYEQMYRGQLWLNVVINKLARGIGRLPFEDLRPWRRRRTAPAAGRLAR